MGGGGGDGCPKTSQCVSGVTTIYLTQCNTSPWVDYQVVDCGPLLCNGCVKLNWTGTRCRIRRSRASQTCSTGDMSGEYAGHERTGMLSASRNCVQILATWDRALSCCNMRWCSWMNGTTMGLRISSRYQIHLCSLSITYTCPYYNPTATMGHSIHNVDISKLLAHMTPYTLYSENQDSSVKRTPLQSARLHRMWAFSHSSLLRRRTAVRSRPWWGWRACRWASLRRFVQKFFGYANRLLQQLSGWLVSNKTKYVVK